MRRKFLSSSSRGEEKPAMTSSEGGGRRLRTTRLLDTSAPSSEPRPSSTCPLSSSRHFSNSKRVAVIFSNLWFHQGPHVSNFYSNVYPPSLANGGNFADIFYYICKKKKLTLFYITSFVIALYTTLSNQNLHGMGSGSGKNGPDSTFKVAMVDQFLLSAGLFSSSSDLAPILATVCRL